MKFFTFNSKFSLLIGGLLLLLITSSAFNFLEKSLLKEDRSQLTLSENLFLAYELANCEDESIFYSAYESTLEKEISSMGPQRAMMMPIEVEECFRVSSCDGDAEQWRNGGNYITCDANTNISDLEIGVQGGNSNIVGMHWGGWSIPQGATILEAYVQFTAQENSIGAASFNIYGEAHPDPSIFDATNDVVSRTATANSVSWTPGTWIAGDFGTAQRTPDITAIIQEIVNQPAYVEGNPIVLGITGKGTRTAVSYDIDPSEAPELCIRYELPDPPSVTCDGCPDISVVSLDGIPNFPQVDLLNVCSVPDTSAIMIYNNGECPIRDVLVRVVFDSGLSYGGFVMDDANNNSIGTIMPYDLTDLTEPVFIVTEIDSGEVFIANFGVQADCNVDVEQEEALNFDVFLDYSYDDANGMEMMCPTELTEIGAYNSGIKIPVINVLTISPPELNITSAGTPTCQRLTISQDGIGAFLDEFTFQVSGLDTNIYKLSGIEVNDVALSGSEYSYSDVSQTVTATIGGAYFPGNFHTGANGDNLFDSDERLTVDVCYEVEGCLEETAFLTYSAFYGCNNQICFDRSRIEGALAYTPDFGATVSAVGSDITYGGICGDDVSYTITISSNNTDPLEGLWQDLLVKYKACLGSGMTISGLQVNGVDLPETVWEVIGSTLVIDFSNNTDPTIGLTDEDGGGQLNDLVGGESLVFTTMIDIGCSEGAGCGGDLACNLNTIEVNGKRNCGQDFQEFETFPDPVNFFYGEIDSDDNTKIIQGYGIPITENIVTVNGVWNPSDSMYNYSYEFGFENIEPCANPGGIKLIAYVAANGDRIKHIRYEENSATYQGNPVMDVDSYYDTVVLDDGVTLDTIGLIIEIPAGDPDAALHDYWLNLEFEGFCAPADYMSITYKVVEVCNGCGDIDPCEIVRSCGDANSYVRWNGSNCPCAVRGTVGELYRTNYGFADKEMTMPLTREDVPEADQRRFLPGDTLFYSAEFLINDVEEVKKADHYWNFFFYNSRESAPVVPDTDHASFKNWYWYDASTDTKIAIGIPTCLLDYPNATRDNFYYPAMFLDNLGTDNQNASDWDHPTIGAANNWGQCENDPDINPDFPTDNVVYRSFAASSTDWVEVGYQRLLIYWGRPEGCPDTGGDTETGTSEDHINPCLEQFWEQFPMENGDKIIVEVETPMMHNPGYDLNQLNGGIRSESNYITPYFYGYTVDEGTCANSTIFTSCNSSTFYQSHLPGPVGISNEVVVEDCETTVNYEFSLGNAVPTDLADGELPWFENEYRPFYATEYLEFQFPNNMVYEGDGVIIMPDGTEVTWPSQYIADTLGNLACIGNDAIGVCCSAADTNSLAALRLVDEQYLEGVNTPYGWGPDGPNESNEFCDRPHLIHEKGDPYPHLMVGGTETCTYGIRYSLTALCPEDVESTDFRLAYQFAEPYIPHLAHDASGNYYGSPYASSGARYTSSFYWMFPNNPFGENCQVYADEPDEEEGCLKYFQKITTDPEASPGSVNPMRQTSLLITSPDNFTDNSLDYPPLMASIQNLLEADLPGESERNLYEVCAGTMGGMATHMNVVTSIEVPNTVDFLNAYDDTGAPLVWTLASTTPTSNIYAIVMNDIPPGECEYIDIETELLFCPVGLDISTLIQITTVSGCVDPAKAAQLTATGGACDAVGAEYQYVAEEADLQVEWDPSPMGEYGLCETIPLGVRIKNVKPAVLVNIVNDWWFPDGLTPVSGSWQVCYPGGPGNTGPCMSIPAAMEPTVNAAQQNVFGTNYSWDEDADWNTFIDQNGLPGILSDQDSNRVQILFEVETECDAFTSGSSIYYQAQGADPCEGTVLSMFVESDPIIINGANPADYAQFFVVADPTRANCGGAATITLTFLNISPFGESEESFVCMDLETSAFNYMPGSFSWVSPVSHSPTITETMNGSLTHVCFDIPDGIGPGEAFQLQFDFEVPDDVDCGSVDLGVGVESEIMDVSCMAQGTECSVFVLNSVNPTIEIDYAPPLNVDDQTLTASCPNAAGEVDICYEVTMSNPGDPYSGEIELILIRDLNFNGQLDDFDTELASMSEIVNLSNPDTYVLEGCFTVDESVSCPVFLKVMQMTDCVCDAQEFYFDSIEPDVVNTLGESYALCPGAPLIIENCASWDYEVMPFAGASISQNATGDSIYIELNDGYGIGSPVLLTITSQTGGCMPFTFPIELYSLSGFEFPTYDPLLVCTQGCRELDLGLPAGYEGSMSAVWSPSDYLDDPTALKPMICDPASDITYTVTLTFMEGDQTCEYEGPFPVEVQEQVLDNSFEDANLCNASNATIEAPEGYTNYEWTQVLPDGTSTVPQSSSSNTFTATEEGVYSVKYWNLGDVCQIQGNMFNVASCIELDKRFISAVPASNANEYTVTYEIEVLNPSIYGVEYDLYDISGFNDNVTILTAGYSSDVPSAGPLSSMPVAPGDQLADDVVVAGESSHLYTLEYVVRIDLEGNNGGSGDLSYESCGMGAGASSAVPGEGLFNESTLDTDEDLSTEEGVDSDCGELPYLVMSKDTIGMTSLGGDCYTLEYLLTVENIGGAAGMYDLVDMPGYDADFEVSSVSYTTSAVGNIGGGLLPSSPTWILAEDQSIAASVQDSFWVVVEACLDLAGGSGNDVYDASCGSGASGSPQSGEGLFNAASLDVNGDGVFDAMDTVCMDVPVIELSKTFESFTLMDDGSFNVMYTIEVCNVGGIESEYDLLDLPGYDADISINSAMYTSDVPSNAALPVPVPMGGWILGDDVSIAGGGVCHTYNLLVNVSADLSGNAEGGDGQISDCGSTPLGVPMSGEGLYNEALIDLDDDGMAELEEQTCGDLEIFDLALIKTVNATTPGPFAPGSLVTFDLTVMNQGSEDAFNVLVKDYFDPSELVLEDADWTLLSPGVAELSNEILLINPGLQEVVQITFRIAEDFMGDSITNDSEISSADDDTNPNNAPPVDIDSTPDDNSTPEDTGNNDDTADTGGGDDQDPETIMIGQVFDLALIKEFDSYDDANMNGQIDAGEDVTYKLTVVNQGTLDAYNVEVTDNVPMGMLFNQGDNVDFSSSVGMGASATSPVATIAGPIMPMGSEEVYITLQVDPDFMGSSIVNDAEISFADDDEDPDNTPPVDEDSTPGDNATPDDLTNNNDLEDTEGGDDQDPEMISIGQVFDLALIKTVNSMLTDSPLEPGGTVVFDITVYNQGSLDAYNINVNDYIPTGLTLNDANWTEVAGVADLDMPIGFIAAGDDETVTIEFLVDNDFMGSSITNNAEISEADDDEDPTNTPPTDIDSDPDSEDGSSPDPNNDDTSDVNGNDDYDPETVVIGQTFDLALVKTLSSATPGPFSPGDEVTFNLTVYNQGTLDAYNVELWDYVPMGLELSDVAWSMVGGVAVLNNEIAFIGAGQDETVTITFEISEDFMGSSITNDAEISAADDDTDPDNDPPVDEDSVPGDNDTPNDSDNNDDTADTGGGDDQDPETIEVGQVFDLALIKAFDSYDDANMNGQIDAGEDVTYKLTVYNQGTLDAYNVEVTDNVPVDMIFNQADNMDFSSSVGMGASATSPVATIAGPIMPMGSEEVYITLQVDPDFMGSSIVNDAEISFADDDEDPANAPPVDEDSVPGDNATPEDLTNNDDVTDTEGGDDQDPEEIAIGQVFDLALIKTVNGTLTDSPLEPGGTVVFDIRVYNQGSLDAYNINVNDYIPAGLTLNDANWTEVGGVADLNMPIGFIAAGDNEVVTIEFTVDNDFMGSSITNNAEISEADDDEDLTNTPPVDVDSEPDSEDGSSPDPNNNDLDDVNGNDDYDPETVTIGQTFDLALVKTLSSVTPGPFSPGDAVTFTLTVYNQGTLDAYNVELWDYVPTGLVLNDANWSMGVGSMSGVAILNNDIAFIGAGLDASVPITFEISEGFMGTSITNDAEIGSADDDTDPSNAPPVDEDSVPGDNDTPNDSGNNDDTADTGGGDDQDPETIGVVQGYDLALIKVLAPGESGMYDPGDDVIFRIQVCNQGSLAALEIEVTDYIPLGLQYNGASGLNTTNGWMASGATAVTTWSVANGQLGAGGLLPDACIDIDIVLTVAANAPQGMEIVNWAEISADDGDDADSSPDNMQGNDGYSEDNAWLNENGDQDDHDPEGIQINFFDLALTKVLASGQDMSVAPGSDVTYRLTIYNQGSIAADNVELTDYIPSCMSLNDGDWGLDMNGYAVYVASVANGDFGVGGLLPGAQANVELTLNLNSDADSDCDLTNWSEISDQTDSDGDPIDDIDSNTDNDPSDDNFGGDGEIDGGNGDEDDHDPAEIELLSYDLALTKDLATDQGSVVAPGDLITYDITVINQGEYPAYEVEVTDYPPSCMTLEDSDWGVDLNGNPVYTLSVVSGDIPVGGILPGEDASVQISLRLANPVPSDCDLTNVAEISGDDGEDEDSDPDGDDSNDPPGEDDIDEVPVSLATFDLALTKDLAVGQSGAVAPGSLVTYDITVINQGEIAADNIEVVDYIPECMSLEDANWEELGGNAYYTLSVANGDIPLGGLPPEGSVSVQLSLRLDNPVGGDCDLTNYSEISDATDEDGMPQEDVDSDPDDDDSNDPPGEDDIDDVGLELLEFDLALTKSLALGQSDVVMVGQDVTFVFTVSNQGDIAADNIEITDHIPADFELNDGDWSGPASGPATIVLSVANGLLPAGGLAPDSEVMVEITLRVLMTALEGEDYVNRGEISDATDDMGMPQEDRDSDPDDDPTNDPDSEDDKDTELVRIMGDCDLSQIKKFNHFYSNGDGTGGTAVFDVIVENQGSCDAYNIGLVDYILPGWTLDDDTWYESPFDGNAYYTLGGPLLPGEIDTVEIRFAVEFFDPNDPQTNWTEITGSEDFNGDAQEDMDSDPDSNPNNDGPPTDNEQDNTNNDEDDHDFEDIQIIDLAIDKSLDESMMGPYAYGDEIVFNICVTNEGNATVNQVTVADYIPVGFSYTAADNPTWYGTYPEVYHDFAGPIVQDEVVCEDIILTFESGGMNADDYTNVTEIVEVIDDMGQVNDDDWDSHPDNDDGDQSEDDEDAEVFRVYDLALAKTSEFEGPFKYGDDMVFDITIYNQGSVPALDVEVTDYVPCGYEFIESAGWSYDDVTGQATTSIEGPILPGQNVVVQLTMKLRACLDDGAWRNYAEISGGTDEFGIPGDDIDSTPDNDVSNDAGGTPESDEDNHVDDDGVDGDGDGITDEDDHDPHEPWIFDLAQIKEVPAGPGPYLFGDIVEYRITICNQGNKEATSIEITDYLPAGLSFDAMHTIAGAVEPGANSLWSYDAVTHTATRTMFGDVMSEGEGLMPGSCAELYIYLEVVEADVVEDWYNFSEISYSEDEDGIPQVDADGDFDDDPSNDDDPNDPNDYTDDAMNNEDGDEDNHDGAEIIVAADVGDTVFKDLDGDGIQDAGEPGVGGVAVSLYTCTGELLETTTTDADGMYLFEQVIPGEYYIEFDISSVGADCTFTFQDQGGDDEADSDVNADGRTDCFVTEGIDRFDIDAGLIPLGGIGDRVWHDIDGDGIQDAGEPGIEGSKVYLYDENGHLLAVTTTDSEGNYLFDQLWPGHYYVKFDQPTGYSDVTVANGGDDAGDSDVDGTNGPGTTDYVWIDAGEYDLTVDAGYYHCIPLGDVLWYDTNGNGVQESYENGINNVKVRLYRQIGATWVLYDQTYTGHKPGTPSDDGYWKFCAPPGSYYVEFRVSSSLDPVRANVGNDEELDSDVTGTNGDNTTSTFVLRSGDHRCDIDGGYRIGASLQTLPLAEILALAPVQEEMDREISIPKGRTEKGYNALSWKAEQELLEDEYYVIEKLTDAGSYERIAKLMTKGAGHQGGAAEYSFEDRSVRGDIQEYRVSIVNRNGSIEKLGEVVLQKVAEQSREVRLYPNITTDIANLRIKVDSPTQVEVMVLTMSGEVVNAKLIEDELSYGITEYRIDTKGMNAGSYMLRIRMNDEVVTKRLIVVGE